MQITLLRFSIWIFDTPAGKLLLKSIGQSVELSSSPVPTNRALALAPALAECMSNMTRLKSMIPKMITKNGRAIRANSTIEAPDSPPRRLLDLELIATCCRLARRVALTLPSLDSQAAVNGLRFVRNSIKGISTPAAGCLSDSL